MSTGVMDSDLRRALAFYLGGVGFILLIILLASGDFVTRLAAEGTSAPPESTPQIIYDVLLVVSVPLLVSSQLWYLRTKHVRRNSSSRMSFCKQALPEAVIAFWVVVTLAVFVSLGGSVGQFDTQNTLVSAAFSAVPLSLMVLFGGLLVYYPVIVTWNVRRTMSTKYPETDPGLKTVSSVVLGLVLAVAYVVLVSFVLLISVHSIVR